MGWYRNRWVPGVLLAAAPLLLLIPALIGARPAAPAQPERADTPVAIATAPPPPPTPTSTALPPPPTPTPRPLSLRAAEPTYVPILMYHYVREVDPLADPLGHRLSVRPDRFAEQLRWLRDAGYETLLMRELAACLRGAALCPRRAVALTFDDGYADNAEAALPLLQRYGFRATFYIVTGLVGREGYMSWEQVAQLRDAGMEVGAHTVSHADLAGLDPEDALREIRQSQAALERALDTEVVSFSYPAGSYTPALARAVRDAGFTSAVTTAPGDELVLLYELPRRRVLGGETIEGYPWYFVPPSRLER